MMSPKLLERATFSFRQGYLHGYYNEPRKYQQPDDSMKPFGEFDYNEGYEAGKASAYWNRMSLSERRAESKRRQAEANAR